MSYIIKMATFEALPMDEIYENVPVFDFQWTSSASVRSSFERIDVEDRVFIRIMGAMFVFMLLFLAQVLLTLVLSLLRFFPFTWLHKRVRLQSSV